MSVVSAVKKGAQLIRFGSKRLKMQQLRKARYALRSSRADRVFRIGQLRKHIQQFGHTKWSQPTVSPFGLTKVRVGR